MQSRIFLWVSLVLFSLLLINSPAMGKGKGRPGGWDKGRKKGRQSDVPPGLEKMQDAVKEKGRGNAIKEKKEGFRRRWFGKGKKEKGE